MTEKNYDYITAGLEDDRFKPKFGWLVISIVSLTFASFYVLLNFSVVDVKSELLSTSGDVFLKYFFIVVAVERAAAVFVGISRSRNRAEWTLRIKRISEVLAKEEPSLSILKQVYTREKRLVSTLVLSNKMGEIGQVKSETPTEEDYLGYLMSTKHA